MRELSEVTALECIQNSQINFENLVRFFPQLKSNPIYLIAKEQLDNGLSKLEAEEE